MYVCARVFVRVAITVVLVVDVIMSIAWYVGAGVRGTAILLDHCDGNASRRALDGDGSDSSAVSQASSH